VANSNRDTAAQKWGYTLDKFFNTAYVGILYSLNILMVFYTASTADIVLNALAIDFIKQLDEVRGTREERRARGVAGTGAAVGRALHRLHRNHFAY
jgi:hypothetical protein